MAAEGSGAAACNRQQDLLVLPVDPSLTPVEERLAGEANDISHLQRKAFIASASVLLVHPEQEHPAGWR